MNPVRLRLTVKRNRVSPLVYLPIGSLSTRPEKPFAWEAKKDTFHGKVSKGIFAVERSDWVFYTTGASIRSGLEDRFDGLDQSREDLVRIGLGVWTTVFEVALVA